jgi:hypothetical protein
MPQLCIEFISSYWKECYTSSILFFQVGSKSVITITYHLAGVFQVNFAKKFIEVATYIVNKAGLSSKHCNR